MIQNFARNKWLSTEKSLSIGKFLSIENIIDRNHVSFQSTMKIPLVVGHCLGLIPVQGVLCNTSSTLRFTMKSPLFLYAMLIFMIQTSATALCVYRLFRIKVSFEIMSYFIFYGGVALTTALFFRVALKWPTLAQHISRSEDQDPSSDRNLKKKCARATFIIMFLACIEHILSVISKLSEILIRYAENDEVGITFANESFPWFFEVVSPDNLMLRITVLILNMQATLNWNYTDLFIICISFYLVSRFDHVYCKLKAAKNKHSPSQFWRAIREDYNRVVRLVREIDDVIGGVVFVSFASNLFFICLQLYNTLSDGVSSPYTRTLRNENATSLANSSTFSGYEHHIYHIYSLAFLLSRSLASSLIAAKVHSATLMFAPELYCVPTSLYCIEIQRFLDQLHGETVALSGLSFFKVTRGLILSVAGTIVTYELVLIQFNVSNNDKAFTNNSIEFAIF